MGNVRNKNELILWQISKMSHSDAAQQTHGARDGARINGRQRQSEREREKWDKCDKCISCPKCMHEFILLLFIAYLPMSPNICLQNHAKA